MKFVVATHNEGKLPEIVTIVEGVLGQRAVDMELVSAGSLGLPDPVETGVTFEENALLKARDVAKRTGLPALADDSGLIVDVMGRAPGILSARWSGSHGDDTANMNLLLAQLADIPDNKRTARFCCAAALVVPVSGGRGSAKSRADEGVLIREARSGQANSADGYFQETVRLGEMKGVVIRAPRGGHGFGYDPIFVPDDQPADHAVGWVHGDVGAVKGSTRMNMDYDASINGREGVRRRTLPLTSAEMTPEEKNAISHRCKAFTALAPAIGELLRTVQ